MKNTSLFIQKLVLFIAPVIMLNIACSKSDDAAPPVVNNPIPFEVPATEDIVMYEVNFAALSSTKNIQGVINKLDQLKALGINTVWLMPIHPVGIENSFGSPYCIRNFTDVNASLGTIDNLKALVDAAHSRNMAVILDWVANHTSWDHVWTNNPGWHTTDGNGNIIHPQGTNWNDVADLNFGNAQMRLAMIDAMKFWVTTADVDGFRCDAADFVPFDFWQQAIIALDAIPNKELILLAEGARADHFTAGFEMNFAWDYLATVKTVFGSNQSATNLFAVNNNEYAVVPEGKRKLRFTTNHDESNIATPISVYGGKPGALAASVITIFLDGVPMLYSGQEVGVGATSIYNGTNTINWSANGDMHETYKKLMAFYNNSPASRKGIVESFATADVAAYKKTFGAEQVVVIVNTRPATLTYTVPTALQQTWNNAFGGLAVTLGTTVSIPPYGYMVLKN